MKTGLVVHRTVSPKVSAVPDVVQGGHGYHLIEHKAMKEQSCISKPLENPVPPVKASSF